MSTSNSKIYALNWKNHMNHIRNAFDHLLNSNELTDVTLYCQGKKIGAHRMLLSACSAYFKDVFKDLPGHHPVVVLYGIEYGMLKDILNFIYKGEVSVETTKLNAFLKVAQSLQISGLSEPSIAASAPRDPENKEVAPEDLDETFVEGLQPVTTSEEPRPVKRQRLTETEPVREKIETEEAEPVFVSNVKCEPTEFVSFDEPLEDPLHSDQTNDVIFPNDSNVNFVDEEFKIEVEEQDMSQRFVERNQPPQKSIPKNTLKTKTYVWTAFTKFCKERNYLLGPTSTVQEISEILTDWGFNMKRVDGTDYKEGVVKTIWNCTAKMMQELFYEKYGVSFDPFRDIEFKKARDSRDSKRLQLKFHPGKRKIDLLSLSEAERHQLYGIWNENSPSGLQKKFYHVAAFELTWREGEAAGCLTKHFRQVFDLLGDFTGRIEYNGGCGSKWLVANSENPNFCSVRLFLKMLEKRKTNANIRTERLFLTPNPNWNRTATSAWYKDCPVGKNQIVAWTKEASERMAIDMKSAKVTNVSIFPSTSKMV